MGKEQSNLAFGAVIVLVLRSSSFRFYTNSKKKRELEGDANQNALASITQRHSVFFLVSNDTPLCHLLPFIFFKYTNTLLLYLISFRSHQFSSVASISLA